MHKLSASRDKHYSSAAAPSISFSWNSEISSPEMLIQDIQRLAHEYIPNGFDLLNKPIVIAKIPVENKEKQHTISLAVTPTQDLIDETIIENIRAAGSLDLLNLFYIEGNDEAHDHAIRQLVASDTNVKHALINAYCDVLLSAVAWVKSQKKLLTLRREMSTEIYIALEQRYPAEGERGFTPEQYDLVTDGILSLGMYGDDEEKVFYNGRRDKLRPVSDAMGGFSGAKKVKLFLEHIETQDKELAEHLIGPIHKKHTEVQIDTKYLYLDNGHALYDKILHESAYHDYYEKDLAFLKACGPKIAPYIKRRYISLGAGNGAKDFMLLSHVDETNIASIILVDGSLQSLKEAEERFTGTRTGIRGYKDGVLSHKHLAFSQDWIDSLSQENGKMEIFHSAFSVGHTTGMGIREIHADSSSFSVLGSTFGNFSAEYKKIFLQDMGKIMKKGDTLLISVFNQPETFDEIEDTIAHYDTPQTHAFMKNFFRKLGIPEDTIDVEVTYQDHILHIDALVRQGEHSDALHISIQGSSTELPKEILFKGFESERINEQRMKQIHKESKSGLTLKDTISLPGNPFSIYVFEK